MKRLLPFIIFCLISPPAFAFDVNDQEYKYAAQSLKFAYNSTDETPTIWIITACNSNAPGDLCGKRGGFFDMAFKRLNQDTGLCDYTTAKVSIVRTPGLQADPRNVMSDYTRVFLSLGGAACDMRPIRGSPVK